MKTYSDVTTVTTKKFNQFTITIKNEDELAVLRRVIGSASWGTIYRYLYVNGTKNGCSFNMSEEDVQDIIMKLYNDLKLEG